MKSKVSYTAIVLNGRSKDLLISTFSHLKPKSWQWLVDHMTICMGSITDFGIRSQIGQTKILSVTAFGGTDKAIAVKVAGYYSEKENPHITLAINTTENGRPKDSDTITDWEAYDGDLRLTGVVAEIDLDGAIIGNSFSKMRALPFVNDVKALDGKIYQVGGAVRDQFLGKDSKDLDILIQGVPADQIKTVLEKHGKVDMVGTSFGIIKFKAHGTDEEIDIAIPRTERKIGAGYTGFEVTADTTSLLNRICTAGISPLTLWQKTWMVSLLTLITGWTILRTSN
jgi:hypothetical protein